MTIIVYVGVGLAFHHLIYPNPWVSLLVGAMAAVIEILVEGRIRFGSWWR